MTKSCDTIRDTILNMKGSFRTSQLCEYLEEQGIKDVVLILKVLGELYQTGHVDMVDLGDGVCGYEVTTN